MKSTQRLTATSPSVRETSKIDKDEILVRLKVMQSQEESATYRSADYLGENMFSSKFRVDEVCRLKMCQWCYQIVDQCNLQRETVAFAMSYLDRYLSTPSGRHVLFQVRLYQLAAMTSLYTAIKLHEPIALEPSVLVDISHGHYMLEEIEEMETRMLFSLNWFVNDPTPQGFARLILSLFPDTVELELKDEIHRNTIYQLELAVAHYALSGTKPSSIAVAAVANALESVENEKMNSSMKEAFLIRLQQQFEFELKSLSYVKASLGLILRGAQSDFVDQTNFCLSPPISNQSDMSGCTGEALASNTSSPVCVLRGRRTPQ